MEFTDIAARMPLLNHHGNSVPPDALPRIDPNAFDFSADHSISERQSIPRWSQRVEHIVYEPLQYGRSALARHLPAQATDPSFNFVKVEAARTVAAPRSNDKRVLLHCVASYSRAPTVAVAHATTLGLSPDSALPEVCRVLPAAHPIPGFHATRKRLEDTGTLGLAESVARNPQILDPRPSTVSVSTAGRTT